MRFKLLALTAAAGITALVVLPHEASAQRFGGGGYRGGGLGAGVGGGFRGGGFGGFRGAALGGIRGGYGGGIGYRAAALGPRWGVGGGVRPGLGYRPGWGYGGYRRWGYPGWGAAGLATGVALATAPYYGYGYGYGYPYYNDSDYGDDCYLTTRRVVDAWGYVHLRRVQVCGY
jgi:hypothetical protein